VNVLPFRYITMLMALLSWFLFLAGCTGVGSPGAVNRAEILLGEVGAHISLNDTYIARAALEVRTSRGRFPLQAALVFRHPDLLRMESLPLIGPSDFFLLADGTSLTVYLPVQGKCYTGKATARNLSRFLPFPLSPRDVVSILMGRAPAMPKKGEAVSVVADGSLTRVDEQLAGGGSRSLWIDPERKDLVRMEGWSFFGKVEYRVKFLDFTGPEGSRMPYRIEVTAGEDDSAGITIRYVELQHTTEDDPSLFVFSAPPEVEVHVLDGRTNEFP
jgi:outer membrane lipoprotein-sorting protein